MCNPHPISAWNQLRGEGELYKYLPSMFYFVAVS